MDLRIYSESSSPSEEKFLGQFIPLHYHFNMLQDQHRVGAFAEAIKAVVKPGMHVVELGGGTGILSWLAAQQGARVTCVERNSALVNSARELLAKNHHGERVKVIQEDAFDQRAIREPICEKSCVAEKIRSSLFCRTDPCEQILQAA